MENLILRRMREEDAASAVIICRKCFGKSVVARKGYLENAAWSWRYKSFVAELDEKIVACACAKLADWFEDYWEAKKDTAAIEVFAVDPDYQGQGIGTKLFSKLINELEEGGVKSMHLLVHPGNTPAIDFYEHFGFKYFGHNDSAFMTRMTCTENLPSDE